ncbi:MAG: response regulator [Myxococcota bacterium]|nr:response regulator [Myxococcota bacterium]
MPERRHRLLIVDDDLDTRELLAEALSDEFEVIAVGDAQAALTALETFAADVVLTDESLPGMRGAELAAVLKRRPDPPRVILFSGHLTIPGAEAADLILRKPLDLPELHQAVATQALH